MSTENYDWLDVEYDPWSVKFGLARQELYLAEEAFSVDLPDDILLKLYEFVVARRSENTIWEVIVAQTNELLLRRMRGGPTSRLAGRPWSFDPEDHEQAIVAVRNEYLTNSDLLSLYLIAQSNFGAEAHDEGDAKDLEAWKRVLPLVCQHIIGRMGTTGR